MLPQLPWSTANEDLVDVVSCTKITADSNGGVTATASGGNPMIIVPASSLSKKGSVCTDLATGNQSSSSNTSGAASMQWSTVAAALGAAAFFAKLMI